MTATEPLDRGVVRPSSVVSPTDHGCAATAHRDGHRAAVWHIGACAGAPTAARTGGGAQRAPRAGWRRARSRRRLPRAGRATGGCRQVVLAEPATGIRRRWTGSSVRARPCSPRLMPASVAASAPTGTAAPTRSCAESWPRSSAAAFTPSGKRWSPDPPQGQHASTKPLSRAIAGLFLVQAGFTSTQRGSRSWVLRLSARHPRPHS